MSSSSLISKYSLVIDCNEVSFLYYIMLYVHVLHTPSMFSLMTGGSCFAAWETMLSEAEKEAKLQVDLAQKLSQSVANQLSEITVRKRNLKKKVRKWKTAQ